jgi:hypothetical protein
MNDQDFVRSETLKLNVDGLRDQMCAWLRSNGIDPKDIPGDSRMSWTDGQLTTDVFLRNAAGKVQFDPAGKDEIARETRTFAASEPPPLVARWLLPRCPACGR